MKLEEVKQVFDNSLKLINDNSFEMTEFLNGKHIFVSNQIKWIYSIFEQLNKDENPEIDNQKFVNDSMKILIMIEDKTYYDILSNNQIALVNNYCLILMNFNDNMIKDENFKNYISKVNNLVNLRLSLVELINFSRKLIERNKQITHNIDDYFKMSRHYLKQLDKKNEQGCDCKNQKLEKEVKKNKITNQMPTL